jgi:hypothetical protein
MEGLKKIERAAMIAASCLLQLEAVTISTFRLQLPVLARF